MSLSIADYIGKIILVKLSTEFVENALNFLQPANPQCSLFYVRLAGSEPVGLWIENRTWKTQAVDSPTPIEHRAVVLIPWHAVISVAVFPERKFVDGEQIEENGIGFLATINKSDK